MTGVAVTGVDVTRGAVAAVTVTGVTVTGVAGEVVLHAAELRPAYCPQGPVAIRSLSHIRYVRPIPGGS